MENSNAVVAITGATGFIGTQLCTRLRNSGRRVRALVRNPEKAKNLAESGVDLICGDLASTGALTELVSAAGTVVHCAGSVRGNCQRDFDLTNVEGTARLLNAMKNAAPQPRLIMLSSITAREPGLSWYAASKYKSEQLLENSSLPDWIILRPPAVYGHGDREMLPIFQWMARGIALVPGDPDNRTSLIHVEDLVTAIVGLMDAATVPPTALSLCDKDGGYNWHEIAELGQQIWGRRVRLLRIPEAVLDFVTAANLFLSRHLNYAPFLTPAKLRELRHADWVTDNRGLQEVIEWQPGIDLGQGLRDLAL